MSDKVWKIVEKKNLWLALSITIIVLGLGLSVINKIQSKPMFNYGVDFVGGSTLIIKFDDFAREWTTATPGDREAIQVSFLTDLRRSLQNHALEKSSIQITSDAEVIIKMLNVNNDTIDDIRSFLSEDIGSLEVLEIDFIGPTIGAELRQTSLWIVLTVSLSLLLYITWRFELSFGIAALMALLHDALVTLSLASLLSIEINVGFIAALLTILGYSINDTIILFDRIRENINPLSKTFSFSDIANISITQTLSRTINTSATTLGVILALLIFGGTTIKYFSLVLFIGIMAGTYSSIFIASPILVQIVGDRDLSYDEEENQ